MAGKGGAWKVAYADFVTAMMAFFLVMWLISQDQKVKESIARYFMAPVGFQLAGNSTKPNRGGALNSVDSTGPVPDSRLRSGGRGTSSASGNGDPDSETAIFAEWLFDDPAMAAEWQQHAREHLQTAQRKYAHTGADQGRQVRLDDIARRQLSIQLHEASRQAATQQATGVYRELLLEVLSRINWDQLADNILQEANLQPRKGDAPPLKPQGR
jgi:flagellar motor protein MotB